MNSGISLCYDHFYPFTSIYSVQRDSHRPGGHSDRNRNGSPPRNRVLQGQAGLMQTFDRFFLCHVEVSVSWIGFTHQIGGRFHNP